GTLRVVEDGENLRSHQLAEALAVARARTDGVQNAIGRGNAQVRADQQLLERVEGLDVHGSRTPLRRVGDTNDLVEPLDELLLGAGETCLQSIEKAHPIESITQDPTRPAGG